VTTDDELVWQRSLGASDAVLWDIEKDPVLRSTITAVALLDTSPDWDRFVGRLHHATTAVPRLRQRVVVPPLRVGPPQWVDDDRFDLGYHLRRVRAPATAPDDALRAALDVAQPLAMAPFDRARPLWEFTLVEDLPGGRAALVHKVHHSLTDGVGGIRLALTLLDEEPGGPDPEPTTSPATGDDPSARSVVTDSLSDEIGRNLRAVRGIPRAAGAAVARTVRDPVRAAGETVRMAGSAVRLLRPATHPGSPIMRDRTLARRFEALDVPWATLRDAAHAAGGTVNDAFLAAVAGGIAAYHRRHDAELAHLRFTMPINVRHDDDPAGGNRFVPARFTVPATIDDPAVRIEAMGRLAGEWQHEPALQLTEPLAALLDRLPVTVTTSVFGGMLKGVDAVVTNVPGVPTRCYLAGAEVVGEWAFAPTSGAALSVALISHVGTGCIGITIDTGAVPDPELLTACLEDGFAEILAVPRK
jgi:WS/DGAT/MGAT family acyltransferase